MAYLISKEDLCSLYAQAYNSGHNDTVESVHTAILPVDYNDYFEEEILKFVKELNQNKGQGEKR